MLGPGCSFVREQDSISWGAAGAPGDVRMRRLLGFRTRLRLTAVALLALLLTASAVAASPAVARASKTKVIRYHGYRVVIPKAWPVYDLATDPTVCVRFNRHAVYLGRPGVRQHCPAHAV